MGSKLIFAVPSKGRLMEATTGVLAEGGLEVRKTGSERGYRGEIVDVGDVEIAFISASEIANALRIGQVHLGVTGEDLIREEIADAENRVKSLLYRFGGELHLGSTRKTREWQVQVYSIRKAEAGGAGAAAAGYRALTSTKPSRRKPSNRKRDEITAECPILRRARRGPGRRPRNGSRSRRSDGCLDCQSRSSPPASL